MAQNIYDDAVFHQGYSQFPRSRLGLAGAPEWPSLAAMLPAVAGLRILDLGCGFGFFCRWAAENGAAEVLGLDLSEKMLAGAVEQSAGLAIRYERMDLETFDLPGQTFDLIYSSLAVHYLADFDALCAKVRRMLADNCRFVFSMEHPLYAARANPEWTADAGGNRAFLVKDYLAEGERLTDWIAPGIVKYHRTIATCINTLQRNGLRLDHIDEWGPSPTQLEANPEWADDSLRPMFLLVGASAIAGHPNQTSVSG